MRMLLSDSQYATMAEGDYKVETIRQRWMNVTAKQTISKGLIRNLKNSNKMRYQHIRIPTNKKLSLFRSLIKNKSFGFDKTKIVTSLTYTHTVCQLNQFTALYCS